ncbi:MAG: hypothetical protein AMXMBFR22_22490 [Phycisphaerae bacterium]
MRDRLMTTLCNKLSDFIALSQPGRLSFLAMNPTYTADAPRGRPRRTAWTSPMSATAHPYRTADLRSARTEQSSALLIQSKNG